MSALRLGRDANGHRIVVIEQPARGRVQGAGGVSLGYFSGTVVVPSLGGAIDTESERDRQLRMQREAMRKARAK